ncbi:hypothetical protein ALC56_13075 [Trachymyrmex septentrionalis]|uniref:FAST kinase domain-containing protein 2 n=2 Tax=Trachymyrmex septentrionalis TaxID=34720 RepID=A0A195EXI8_9HYME|nr:PREDICTED: FAST kinase domain-containing protein 2, mitochondrial-like isoform X2 [Trachymyrmex septentrionalis]XP_018351998.1 PREDICTED: FAST kinase domain-containing protein 2, mitochondrial-like isoform X2 [Trachymyrmex septentrionalis]KYN32594.1 hypothetical protein ALC56_13075 [Trachymyrmex septentrionalis]
MNGALNGLLRLYPIVRHWTVLSNYVVPLQTIQKVSRICNTSLTNHIQLEDCTSSAEKNYVFNDIKSYKYMEILEKITKNNINMTLEDAINTMCILSKAFKHVDDRDLQNINQHIGFMHLCEVLNRNIRLMKTNEIIISLKVLTYFKIPVNSVLIQSLLQMIRANINELSLKNIIIISFIFKKMDSTPLRDALLIALPVVFETQLPTKLDPDNIIMLKRSLRFINENSINNPKIQNIILKSLQKFEKDLDAQTAWSILCSLCVTSYLSPMHFELLFNIQKILISNAKQLNMGEILTGLHKLVLAIARNKEYGCKFYNEALMDAFVNSALSTEELSFNNCIRLLKHLNDLNYVHIPFLEYLAAKCFEKPKLLENSSYFRISIFLEGLINADYKPVFWDIIRNAILANEEILENKMFNTSMIQFVLHLIALDCYSPSLISKVFSQICNKIIKTDPMNNIYMRELLLLYQSVKTLYPMYNGPWPSQDLLEDAVNIHRTLLSSIRPTFSLKPALELALGGPQYVHNSLRTKLGHYIDHVIVMRKGGYPIAINTSNVLAYNTTNVYVEDIQTPSQSQMILIFNLPEAAYAVNSQRIKSTWSLKIKSVEALIKTNVIAINSSSWMKLPEYEKVPYLMRAIRLKCEDDSSLTK